MGSFEESIVVNTYLLIFVTLRRYSRGGREPGRPRRRGGGIVKYAFNDVKRNGYAFRASKNTLANERPTLSNSRTVRLEAVREMKDLAAWFCRIYFAYCIACLCTALSQTISPAPGRSLL